MKTRWTVYLMAFAAAFAVLGLLGHACFKYAPHWSETPDIRRKVGRLRRVAPGDIHAIEIGLSCGQGLTLERPNDNRSIDQLFDSLKRVAVTGTECHTREGDYIVVISKGQPYDSTIRIDGCFDPKCAPVVSEALRSDDLGRIVYDIFRSKGLEPRKGKPER